MARDADESDERDRADGGHGLDDGDLPNARRRLLSGLARRLQNPRQLSGDAMDVMAAVLETSDRAKTEMVKMVAREVRNYLEELRLKDDLKELITGHSLEVKLSLSLKPLADAVASSPASASAPPRPRPAGDPGGDKARPARAATVASPTSPGAAADAELDDDGSNP
ncbi:MAG: hypothetical protein H6733_07705 [Alphaproteobacteria bacterium]|nr:hypothetical protein [Alphaproteobacteria bacterium]